MELDAQARITTMYVSGACGAGNRLSSAGDLQIGYYRKTSQAAARHLVFISLANHHAHFQKSWSWVHTMFRDSSISASPTVFLKFLKAVYGPWGAEPSGWSFEKRCKIVLERP